MTRQTLSDTPSDSVSQRFRAIAAYIAQTVRDSCPPPTKAERVGEWVRNRITSTRAPYPVDPC